MTLLDYSIIFAYLLLMIFIGLYFQRKASAGIDSYFLADRSLSWWTLGASGMASNLDVSGTMINAALVYAFGAAGFFVEIRGGIVLIMAFLMIFMGKWNHRAGVMTMAEWMKIRFGSGKEGKIARFIAAVATLITTIWIITYFAVGGGKFLGEFLGIPAFLGISPDFWAAVLMIFISMIYTVASGLYGVVWTDVFQSIFIFITIIVMCIISFTQFNLPEIFSVSVPHVTSGFIEIPTTRSQWTSIIPGWQLNFPADSQYSIYNLFGIAIIFYLLKTIIDGSAGTGGYMIQRFYAAKSEREAGLLSLFWIFLLSFRWPFIAAIAVMGVGLGVRNGAVIADPETVLPIVINQLVPKGLKGLMIAGLMAAAMSTFTAIVNAGASYWVKDIYQTLINPRAGEKQLLRQSRWSSILIVVAGLFLTFNVKNINEIWGWLTMGIGAGMLIPLLIRWYWWRLNAYGFAAGIVIGMMAAILQKILLPHVPEYVAFSIVASSSLAGTLIATLLTPPTEYKILSDFYHMTRPFGFWKPVRQHMAAETVEKINKENRRDIAATFFAVPWQLVLFATGMMFIFKRWDMFMVLLILLIVLSIALYLLWFRHLSDKVKTD